MERNETPLESYAYLDSQRLKDTFFSPPKKKRRRKPHHKRILAAPMLLSIAIVAILLVTFFTKYEFMLVKRQNAGPEQPGLSLFHSPNLSELKFLGEDKQLMRKGNSFVYLSIPPQEKVGFALSFKKPIDLAAGTLLLYLKQPEEPITIEVIVKDNKFYSNSISPLVIEVGKTKAAYSNLPIDLKNTNIQNTNLTRITEIKLYFSHKEHENINRVLIKEIFLAKGGN